MTESVKKPEVSEDEVDLFILLDKVIRFIKRFGFLILMTGGLGLIAALGFYYLAPKKYSSRLILRPSTLTNLEYMQIVNTWNDLLYSKDYDLLAASMNIEPRILHNVNTLSADEIQKLYVEKNPYGFIVHVNTSDTSILNTLQSGIVYGLENNEYVKQRVAYKRESLQQLIGNISNEIKALDSTKREVEKLLNTTNGNANSLIVDISNINSAKVELNEKLSEYEEELRFTSAVHVIQQLNHLKKSERIKLRYLLPVGLIGGTFIGILIASILLLIGKFKKRYPAKL
jgi:LPS O-antigen subunit length determinant protein (WzzB/FepE family)